MLTGAALAVAACSGSTPSADLALQPPGADVLQPCEGPVRLFADDDTQLEQERQWAADRRRLVVCQRKHAAAMAWIGGVMEAVDG